MGRFLFCPQYCKRGVEGNLGAEMNETDSIATTKYITKLRGTCVRRN